MSTNSPSAAWHPAHPMTVQMVGPSLSPFSGRQLALGDSEQQVFMGITRREWFMAHAPAEPPEWFFPTMRPCPEVPSVHRIADLEFRRRVMDWMDGGGDDQQAEAWSKAQDSMVEQQEQWQAEFRKELTLQWPGYWADEMLKRSGA